MRKVRINYTKEFKLAILSQVARENGLHSALGYLSPNPIFETLITDNNQKQMNHKFILTQTKCGLRNR